MMNINQSSLEFFLSIPDEILVQIAIHDRGALEKLCMALSLDLQLLKEESNESFSNWGDVC